MSVIGASHSLTLNRDSVFQVLMGNNLPALHEALDRVAARVAAYTGEDTAFALARVARLSRSHAQCVFAVFLHADPELRAEVVRGSALDTRTQPLCEYKAAVFFANLFDHVISPWIRTEENTPADLVSAFRDEYLVS